MGLQTKVGLREFGRGVGISDTMVRRHKEAGLFYGAESINENNGRPMLIMPLALKLWTDAGLDVKGEYSDGRWGEYESAPKHTPPAEPKPQEPTKEPKKRGRKPKPKPENIQKEKPEKAIKEPKPVDPILDTMFTPVADRPKTTPELVKPPQTPVNIPVPTVENGAEIPLKSHSERVKAFYQAESERIKVEEKLKTLVPRDKVERQLFQVGQKIRTDLEAMPRRIAAFMTGNKKIDEHRMRIEIENILKEFVKEQKRVFMEESENEEE